MNELAKTESGVISATLLAPTRRQLLTATAAVGAVSLLPGTLRAAVTDDAIQPFRVNIADDQLDDLRQRILATRWPEKETVADQSQGVQLATMQTLARYWATDYDWRKGEAKLNAYPQFITKIDGLDIHFLHVRSKHEHALPLIVTHGWPGSVFEQLKIIEPLTDPTRAWRQRIGRVSCRDSIDGGLRFLWQANDHRLGS
ncbi:Epoxide hydrolase domain protein (part2) [Rhizobium mesoamericanum STM3625]|uniref:Epoxide hydrolase domain protein (Part2) n=1 Tax=Rhizobium mesoamericanum STM3625 TaxID=1211777 RepID=K0PK21_9HYPH|nr:Epoxide hydrolase domain protein (part2) [Rhizobium mesoamericanum STM3625]